MEQTYITNRELKNKGRQIILLSNQSYLDNHLTEYLTQLKCPKCNMIVYRQSGKHFGQCLGCGSYNFKFYQLTPTQEAIVSDFAEIVVSYGAMNNGKTDAFAYKSLLMHCLKYSNAALGVVCHSMESIQQTVIPTIRQFLPEGLVKRKNGKLMWNNKQIMLKNGSSIVFFPSDKQDKIRSFNASCIWVPEATGIKEEIGVQLAGRLRRKVLEKAKKGNIYGIFTTTAVQTAKNIGQVLLDGNPVIGSWIDRCYLQYVGRIYITKESDINDFLLMLSSKEKMLKTISLHNYPSISNPYVKTDGGRFLSLQKTAYGNENSVKYQQNILGKIIAGEGLVYPHFRKTLMTPCFLDYSKMNFYIGVDLGWSNACATIIVGENQQTGNLYVLAGYKEKGLDVATNAQKIKDLILNNQIPEKNIIYYLCDSQSSRATHESQGGSAFLQYAQYGIHFTPASKKRETTILHLNTLINSGRLKIFNNLDFLIAEFPKFAYVKKEKTGERTISRRDCDALDALRYAVEQISNVNLIEQQVKEQYLERKKRASPFFVQTESTKKAPVKIFHI